MDQKADVIIKNHTMCPGVGFKVYSEIKEMPVGRYPEYIEDGMVGVCTGGTAVLDVFSNRRRVSKHDLLVILPHMLASISEVSDDYSMHFFRMPYSLFQDVASGIFRMTLDFFFYMRKNYLFTFAGNEYERFDHFMRLLALRADTSRELFRTESIIVLLRVFFWEIYVHYRYGTDEKVNVRYTHKEELAFRFFNLILENHSTNREVSFYADKLFISPKYLTMVVCEVTGQSAKEWIVEYTILEIKSLLRDTMLDIKDVVRKTHFPNQSLMSRFFRKHTGMSPSRYREQIHL